MRKLAYLIALLLGLTAPATAWAHAHLVSSLPAVGGTASPTDTIRLTFSEGIEIKFSKVEVKMDDGMDMGPAKIALDPADDKVVVVTLPQPLDAGVYKLHWQVVSVDTHRTQGDFSFTIK